MRVLFICGRELSYTRNDVLLRAFRRFAQVEVVGVSTRPRSLFTNSIALSARALSRWISPDYDLVFIGFYGHLLMLPAAIFSRQPILFDAFVSTYDTLSSDRQVFSARSWRGRLAYWLDRQACQSARHVLLDTSQHAKYFTQTFNIKEGKTTAIPVGCNEDLFYPRPAPLKSTSRTQVLYYSSFMPLHGVDVVIEAANRLKDKPVDFHLIGEGPTCAILQQRVKSYQLANVTFMPSVPLTELPTRITEADICLGGHFGASDKAGRVVPGKIYQILAMGSPLIATSTPANLDLLSHGENAYLCPPGDPVALANAIQALHQNFALREHLRAGEIALYQAYCSEAVITQRLEEVVRKLVDL